MGSEGRCDERKRKAEGRKGISSVEAREPVGDERGFDRNNMVVRSFYSSP
jgi:hypothetical protein